MEAEEDEKKKQKTNTKEYQALDLVLKPRYTGKKVSSVCSSESENANHQENPKKSKPISKEKNPSPTLLSQVSSTQISNQLLFNQEISHKNIQQLMIKLKNIKSLKYDKLSEKIREGLIETIFNNNFPKFIKIIQAYSDQVGSTHLLHAIFHGFQMAWRRQKFDSIEMFDIFLDLYIQKVPNCLSKRFVRWIKERIDSSQNKLILPRIKKRIISYVNQVIRKNDLRNLKQTDNQKIIGLVVFFDLFEEINLNKLVKIVPLKKINEYTMNDEVKQSNFESQAKQKQAEKEQKNKNGKSNNQNKVPPLVHHSILELIQKNDLKQAQKIIKSYKVSHMNYPQLVEKLQIKYLQYIERTNPIYVVDELVHGKVNLIQRLIDIYFKRKKYDYVDHFVHKYMLRGVQQPIKSKIFLNPLKHQDSFGPTESHVLNQLTQTHFLRLVDFDLSKSNVFWIDSQTIHLKPYTNHLKKLLFTKEIGLDSESSSAIHVFDKARLQIIQIYQPQTNIVLLFDVRDFKNDKKKRLRKNNPSQKKNKDQNKLSSKNQNIKCGQKNSEKTYQLNSQNIQMQKNVQQNEQSKILEQELLQKKTQNKAWFRFTKIIQNVFRNSTIYGHVLHSDIGDILSQLNLNIKNNQLKIKDSQTQFKKYFPQQTKSKLSFLTQKCFGKEISKFQQCSAWDRRPLRNAQKHYAAMDAVLPYKLVKWMEEKNGIKRQ